MNIIRDIKRKIDELSPPDFEEFCNNLLSKQGYGTLHGYGMKAGTGKTTIGNPDAYLRTKNGKYIFVVYTTQKSELYKKIKEDIDKCLNPQLTGLDTKEIQKIICCHTSSNLNAGDDKLLHDYCNEKNIELEILGLDEIGNQVYFKYPSMANLLGISIGTDQVHSLNRFIEKYDSNQMSAPINTIFQYREKEKREVLELLNNYNTVIVSGKSGIGKTRFVLESIKEFSKLQDCKLLCIKNNGQSIYKDLISSTEEDGTYLIFVDDANELIDLNHVLEYNKKNNINKQFKIILTVRDYAKKNVLKMVRNYVCYGEIEIFEFKDEEIEGFLRCNLKILNQIYIKRIIRIAEGNPRIAYMAGKLALENNNLKSIKDSSQLYDAFYEKHIENILGNDTDLCFTAGILSLVNTISLDDFSNIHVLIDDYGIDNKIFKDKIRLLFNMEVVEIHYDLVAKFSDQSFQNYILYYVFLKERIIEFYKIIEFGYKHFRDKLFISINTIINLFNSEEIRKYCTKEIVYVLDKFRVEKEYFEDFVRDFHVFFPEEGFLVAQEKINDIEKEEFKPYLANFNKQKFFFYNSALDFLNGYYDEVYIGYSIQLLLEYASKSEDNLIEAYKWLENNYGIKGNYIKYPTQKIISKSIQKEIENENSIAMAIGFNWAKYSLNFNFSSTELRKKNKFLLNYIWIECSDDILDYRKICWEILLLLATKKEWKSVVISFLYTYSSYISDKSNYDILLHDLDGLDKLIMELKSDNISFLSPIKSIILDLKDKEIPYNSEWDKLFVGDKWELYELFEDRPEDYISNLENYKIHRKNNIINYLKKLDIQDMKKLVIDLDIIFNDKLSHNDFYCMKQGINILVQQLNETYTKEFFDTIIISNSSIPINPKIVLEPIIKNDNMDILESIKTSDLIYKNEWMFCYFEVLPKSKINKNYLDELVEFLKNKSDSNITKSNIRSLRLLDKFLHVESNIYPIVASIIYEKRHYSNFIVGLYLKLLFNNYSYTPDELMKLFESNIKLLEEIYFFMLKNYEYIDYDGTFIVKFLSLGNSWLENYADYFWNSMKDNKDIPDGMLENLWKSNNFIEIYDCIFYNLPIENFVFLSIGTNLSDNLLIKSDDKLVCKNQKKWIKHIISKNAKNELIIYIFSIICNMDSNIKRSALQTFLKHNHEFSTFDKLNLLPSSWITVDSSVEIYEEWLEFLKSLLPMLEDIKFLQHRSKISKKINDIENFILNEKIRDIYES